MIVEASSRIRGQASVELVALIPVLIVCALVLAQLAGAGWATWSAANAARAGARAEHVGGRVERAARSALPGELGRTAKVRSGESVEVIAPVPSVIPGLGLRPARAATSLRAESVP